MTLKLARLKTWLSCEDATKYLATLLDEPVSVTDILQLASDGQLRLSVYFPTPQPAECMGAVNKDEAARLPIYLPQTRGNLNENKWKKLERLRWLLENQGSQLDTKDFFALMDYLKASRTEGRKPEDSELYWLYLGVLLNEDSVLEETGQGVEVRGYWNLELIGGGGIELTNRYLEHIAAGKNDQVAWNGILLRAPEDENIWVALKKYSKGVSEDALHKLGAIHDQLGWRQPEGLASSKPKINPADSLPRDSSIVIHTKELRRFADSLNETESTSTAAATPLDDDTNHAELRRTQRTLAALAAGLAEKHPAYRHGEKTNVKALAEVATEHLRDENGRTPHGFSDKTARDTIAKALKASPELAEHSDKTG